MLRGISILAGAVILPLLPFNKLLAEPVKKPTPSILIIGETGSGKSTFVNMLANNFYGGTLDNLKIAIPTSYFKETNIHGIEKHSESNVTDRTQAQTKNATTYKFGDFCVIDTPGINDTNGLERDDANMEIILNAAINAESLSCIILVLNGTMARVTSNVKALMTRLKGSLPNSVMDNIVVVCTMCRPDTCNIVDFKEIGIKPVNIFFFNNTAFSSNPSQWNEDNKPMLEMEWTSSMKTASRLISEIAEMSFISCEDFKRIRDLRNSIKADLHKAKMEMVSIQNLQEEMELAITTATSAENDINDNKNFTVKKNISQVVFVETPYHSTICGNCNSVCHSHCGLNETRTKGDPTLSGCSCIDPSTGTCTTCTGNCSYTQHYHSRQEPKLINVSVDEELADIKNKYLEAQGKQTSALNRIEEIKILRSAIDAKIANIESGMVTTCTNLKALCRDFNLVDELNILIYQLQQQSKSLTSVQARQTSDKFIDNIKVMADKFSKVETQPENQPQKKKSWFF